jgi:hypothetical protein
MLATSERRREGQAMTTTRTGTETLTRPGEAESIAVVDEALVAASAQRLMRHDDATAILRRVRECTVQAGATDAMAIADQALASCEGDLLVDRERLVNSLLDVRLLLQT